MVSSFKVFCFLFKPFKETFWSEIFVRHLKMKRFMIILLVLNFSNSNVYFFKFHCESSNVTANTTVASRLTASGLQENL